MSDARLIAVPYDSGVRGWRMGAGPDRLLVAQDLTWALLNSPAFLFNH